MKKLDILNGTKDFRKDFVSVRFVPYTKRPDTCVLIIPTNETVSEKNTVLKYVRTLIRGTAFILSANYLCLICSEKRVVLH